MSHEPNVGAIFPGLISMFSTVAAAPGRWFTVPELMRAGPISRATAYRRCGNLVAARVLQRRRRADQVEFTLHPDWAATVLGEKLAERLNTPT